MYCADSSGKQEKFIVRGYAKCEYHDDILKVAQEAAGSGCKLKCVGGGKIKHDDKRKDILVYGTSQVWRAISCY
ncbi:Janus/Ocnus family protein [Oesophagostomum dentatum]|uniref:Janus/Ocnus family protein n=1 Tax=Oesophagostomum dentatum TaxID=61180 RepID=A0A0B1SC06_OESDE|nr:Janus/Ocnus family protein [Oesophagostomum dentatum]